LLLLSVIPTSGELVTAVISAMIEEGTLGGRPERIVTYKFMNAGDAGIFPSGCRPRERSARALGVHGMLLKGQIGGGLISPEVGCHTVAAFLAELPGAYPALGSCQARISGGPRRSGDLRKGDPAATVVVFRYHDVMEV
jgi:hypothetical protein